MGEGVPYFSKFKIAAKKRGEKSPFSPGGSLLKGRFIKKIACEINGPLLHPASL